MRKNRGLWAAVAVLLMLALGAGIYAGDYYRAQPAALAAMAGCDGVTVTQEGNLTVFAPEEPVAGFIFYPGGKVEHKAYASLMLELAQGDILCVLVKMPLNLAVLDVNAASRIPGQYPQVDRWFIGGHSLGGSMAASWAGKNPQSLEGLTLLAAYSTGDLRDSDLKVLSIYGSEDGVLNMEKYAQYRPNLPENTLEMVISGGNHAQFGDYGFQEGDGAASVCAQEQLAVTVQCILEQIHN